MSSMTIIVATDSQSGIGINNTLPWHLPEDLAHFKRTTSGHTIIMGRKTFESIGRPLPNRRNIVISRNPAWQHEGVETYPSITAAQAALDGQDAFIIGGAQIYQQALPLADKLIVTEISQTFACDAFFPAIAPEAWKETQREEHFSEQKQLHYAFVTYEKI
ncbi:dihydrofolate reductase [Undibacterium aquatile]|uniref:Dihydrofolate reductase n=1 Tax=Undibacterium aquatile TaxID=1537398 RepID=A0ABR6XEX6_9BURK|nr:dihydrofolate reductase [Undibacterium aquatile]MBC3811268.1 dihydrofolate reductase [Undibacterium aquatile]